MPRFLAPDLQTFATNLFREAGAPAMPAAVVAASLVANDRCGYESHGIMRVARYIARIENGTMQPGARPAVSHRGGANGVIDGGWGFGQVAAQEAVAVATELSTEFGQAGVAVANAHHVGRLGEYAELLAQKGLVGIVLSGGGVKGGAVAPHGGLRRLFGTNPLAMGVPVPEGSAPLVIDFATAAVAEGKVAVAHANGATLPPGCIIDSEGRESRTPADFYADGALLPFGGHKGYGLMLMIELLATILAGSAPISAPEYAMGNPTLIIAFSVDAFVGRERYNHLLTDLLERIRAMPPAEGFGRVLLPGELEERTRRERDRSGIPISVGVWDELTKLARRSSVALPESLAPA